MNVGVELIAESRFDKQLGPHVRRWAYCHLLFDKCSYALLTQGASLLERIVAWFLMPLLRRIVYSALYCNRPGAKERSLQVVEAIFKEVFVWFPFSPVSRLFRTNSFLFVQPPMCMHSYPACKFFKEPFGLCSYLNSLSLRVGNMLHALSLGPNDLLFSHYCFLTSHPNDCKTKVWARKIACSNTHRPESTNIILSSNNF
jgi:hypothetical protein